MGGGVRQSKKIWQGKVGKKVVFFGLIVKLLNIEMFDSLTSNEKKRTTFYSIHFLTVHIHVRT